MRILAVIFGIVLILLVAQDAFETIVLPRRVTRRIRLARLFYRVTQTAWQSIDHLMRVGARRESYLSYLGPLSLLALIVFWAVLFVFGFALLLWGLALPLNAPEKAISFVTYLYLSGTTFFTLGLVCYGPSCSRRSRPGPEYVTQNRGESAIIDRFCPRARRACSIRHPLESGSGNRAEAGRVSRDL